MRSHFFTIGLSFVLLSGPAAADTNPADSDETRSMSLFEEARRLVDASNCPAAIPKLQESLGLHPSVGAHLSLAQCLEADDPFTAWRELKVAERLALQKGDARAGYARTRARSLEPRLSFVHIRTVPDERVLEVRVDGTAAELWEDKIRVSPGDHVLTVKTGARWSSLTAQATVGQVTEVTVRLQDEPLRSDRATAESPPRDSGASQRRVGLVVGSVGIAALAVGTVAGILTLVDKADLRAKCTAPGAGPDASFPTNCGGGALPASTQRDVSAELGTTHTWATVSTIGVVAGAAALGAGIAIYATAPPSKKAAALRVGPRGAFVESRF
jgi:hypothetical protein